MTPEEVQEVARLLPTFIKMCENDLGEAEHEIPEPLTAEQYDMIDAFYHKFTNCYMHVNLDIFE